MLYYSTSKPMNTGNRCLPASTPGIERFSRIQRPSIFSSYNVYSSWRPSFLSIFRSLNIPLTAQRRGRLAVWGSTDLHIYTEARNSNVG